MNTTPLNDALKPCPFCSGESELVSPQTYAHYVRCMCCSEQFMHSTKAEAIAAWNTRANTQESSAAQGAMTADLRSLLVDCREAANMFGTTDEDFNDFDFRDAVVQRIDAALAAQPTDATAQPIMGALESFVNEVAIGAYTQDELRPKALQALNRSQLLANTAQGKPEQDAIDAQRYRYAVANGVILFDFGSVACVGRAEADKAIDAALAAKKG